MNNISGISVIICCYNSENKIVKTIEHIARQKVNKGIAWELIIVDNNCTDNTTTIANQVWENNNSPTQITITKEPNPGLMNARKKGIDTAQYDILVYCDDDNWLEEKYIQTAYNLMSAKNQVAIAGGVGEAVLEKDWSDFYLNGRYTAYAVGKQEEKTGYTNHINGAGMVVRKSFLRQVSSFKSILLGRTGEKLSSGEDTEMCYWAKILGYRLWYDDSLEFKHFLESKRLCDVYYNKLMEGINSSGLKLLPYYYLLFVKEQNRNKVINFLSGIKNLIFIRKKSNITHLQLLIGPLFNLGDKDSFEFTKTFYKYIYS